MGFLSMSNNTTSAATSEKTIETILLKKYGISPVSIEQMKLGVMNTNYQVKTSTGSFVLRVYQFRDAHDLQNEVAVLIELARHNFPSPKLILRIDGGFVSAVGGKASVLYEYLPGAVALNWNLDHLQKAGVALGKMHQLLLNFEGNKRRFISDKEGVIATLKAKGPLLIEAGFPNAREILDFALSQLMKLSLSKKLPAGVTHQDVKPENVLFENGNISGILDFEFSYVGVLLYDIMTTMIWTCFFHEHLDTSRMYALLKGYERERPLLPIERESFFHALQFRLLREAALSPITTIHNLGTQTERTEYFLRLYHNLKKFSLNGGYA